MTREAALKAWETRRANGWTHPGATTKTSKKTKATARSAAAKKAWVTRRRAKEVEPT